MTDNEKQALKTFSAFMEETADATLKTHPSGDMKSDKSDAPDNKKTIADIKKNDETGKASAADKLKPHATNPDDSKSDKSEDPTSKKTRTDIEKNNKTKEVSYPGKGKTDEEFCDMQMGLHFDHVLKMVDDTLTESTISDSQFEKIKTVVGKKLKSAIAGGTPGDEALTAIFTDMWKEWPSMTAAFILRFKPGKDVTENTKPKSFADIVNEVLKTPQ